MRNVQEVPAVEFQRVSSRAQETDIQLLALARNRELHNLDIKATFILKGKSAYKGQQQEALDEILDLIKTGQAKVVSVAALDRIDRRGVMAMQEWMSQVVKAGGTVVSGRDGEEWVSDTSDELTWSVRLSLEADRARRESQIKSERVRDTHKMIDSNGSTRVRTKLGWKIVGQKYHKQQVIIPDTMNVIKEMARIVASTGRAQDGVAVLAKAGIHRTAETVTNIVNDDAYIEPIGDDLLLAREALRRHAKTRNKKRDTGSTSYAGRLLCRHGNVLYAHLGPSRKDGTQKLYYSVSKGACGKPCGLYGFEAVEKAVDDVLNNTNLSVYGARQDSETILKRAKLTSDMEAAAKQRDYRLAADLQDQLDQLPEPQPEQVIPSGQSVSDTVSGMDRPKRRRWLERQAELGTLQLVIVKTSRNADSIIVIPHAPAVTNRTVPDMVAAMIKYRNDAVETELGCLRAQYSPETA